MDESRREITPLVLHAVTGSALLLSLAAWSIRATDTDNAPLALAASRTQPAVCQPFVRRVATRPYRPALTALAPRPSDYVRCVRAPLRIPTTAPPQRELVVLAPASPRWSAPTSPGWTLFGRQPHELGNDVGSLLSLAHNRVRLSVDWRPALRYFASVARPETIKSPPTLSTGVRVGPGDRVAMLTRPQPAVRSAREKPRAQPEATPAPTTPRPSDPQGEACGCEAIALRAELAKLLGTPETDAWARTALEMVDRLTADPALREEEYLLETLRLSAHAELAHELAEQTQTNRNAVLLRKAGYAIERRATAWQLAKRLEARQSLASVGLSDKGDAAMLPSLRQLASRGRKTHLVESWRDHLNGLLQASEGNPAAAKAAVLQQIAIDGLARAGQPRAAFAPTASLNGLAEVVTPDPVDVNRLISDLEQYELKPRAELAERIAMRQQSLSHSAIDDHQRLASKINQDYRNANLRLAIKDELLRRQLPQPEPQSQPVNDRIAGTPVRGQAVTDTTLALRLTPDPHAWRLALEARGLVESHTVAFGGPARLHSHGVANFVAVKPIIVHYNGVYSPSAQCNADSHTQLMGVRSDYEGVPLVAGIIRSRAEDEYRSSQARARWETENRVNLQVQETLDRQSAEFLERVQGVYDRQVLSRVESLQLKLEPIEVRTTSNRLIARLRLANEHQLAAHTPRNRAPVDSVASLQMHESLLNNALTGLGIAGEPLTPDQLRERLQEKLSVTADAAEDLDEETHDAVFLFHAQPARVVLADGKIELVLAFEELVVDRSRFRDFRVHAFFTPAATLDGVWLTQEEPVQIEGRLRAAKRARLHGVFAKVMPAGKRFTLVKTTAEQRERLYGLMVTQVVVDDGWIGLALGPERNGRVALRERFVR